MNSTAEPFGQRRFFPTGWDFTWEFFEISLIHQLARPIYSEVPVSYSAIPVITGAGNLLPRGWEFAPTDRHHHFQRRYQNNHNRHRALENPDCAESRPR